MRKRHWMATLAALGLAGTTGAKALAQTGSPIPVHGAPAGVPYIPSPAPAVPVAAPPGPALPPVSVMPSALNAQSRAAVPVFPAAPLMFPQRSAPFADTGRPVIAPAQGTVVTAPVASPSPALVTGPIPMTPMPGTPVGSSPGTMLPSPTSTATPGSLPASSGAVSGTPPAPATDTPQVKFSFKPGDEHLLNMDYGNGLFKFYTGGRLQIDGVWYRGDDALTAPRTAGGIGRLDDAVNFRRARFDFGGTFYRNIDFLMEWDFINTFNAERPGNPLAANTPVPTDMWVQFREVPWVGNVRIGNQKPPISFEHMTSSRFLNFLERSLGFDAFVENQNNGLSSE